MPADKLFHQGSGGSGHHGASHRRVNGNVIKQQSWASPCGGSDREATEADTIAAVFSQVAMVAKLEAAAANHFAEPQEGALRTGSTATVLCLTWHAVGLVMFDIPASQ